jgi:hypothetical protein
MSGAEGENWYQILIGGKYKGEPVVVSATASRPRGGDSWQGFFLVIKLANFSPGGLCVLQCIMYCVGTCG